MKKIFAIFAPIALLAACDHPVQDVELKCVGLKIHAQIYQDSAIMDITKVGGYADSEFASALPDRISHVDTVRLKTDLMDEDVGENFHAVMYTTMLADGADKFSLTFQYFPEFKSAGKYMIGFEKDGVASVYDCDILVPYVSKNTLLNPVRMSKERATEIESCIDFIYNNASVYTDQYGNIAEFELKTPRGPMLIDQKQALELSRNWKFHNILLYSNTDGQLYEYELDACDVVDRIKALVEQ